MADSQHCFELLQAGDGDGLRRILEQDSAVSEARDAIGVSLLMQCLYRGRRDFAELIAGRKKLDIFEAAGLGRLDRLKSCIDDLATGSSIDSAPAARRSTVAIWSALGRWKSKRWQRSITVAGTFCASVVARTKTVLGGGSSSVFRNAFQAAVESMCASSRM